VRRASRPGSTSRPALQPGRVGAIIALTLGLQLAIAEPTWASPDWTHEADASGALGVSKSVIPFEDIHRGVSLGDLPGVEAATLAADAEKRNPAGVQSVVSIAALERVDVADGVTWTIQVIGRDMRFARADERGRKKPGAEGALGVVKLAGHLALDRSAAPTWEVLGESPLADLDLRVRVSLSDRAVLVEAPGFGLERVYPAGVGALDEVRRPGYMTSLTPTTELGRVSRATSRMRGPANWMRGQPYLPFEIPWVSTRQAENGEAKRYYVETRIAFHIWQGQAFSRGYNSHGCVTLREEDLAELAAFVFSREAPVALTVRARALPGHRHPFAHEATHYWTLRNLGTPERPRIFRGMFYAIEKVMASPPDTRELADLFMVAERRVPALGPVAVVVPEVPPSLVP